MSCTSEETHISNEVKAIFIEAFYGGSHKQLIDTLKKHVSCTFVSLKAKKWHWRARCSALILSSLVPPVTTEKVLFTSSVVNLAELLGVRSDLYNLKKIVYFHENQLIYPVSTVKDRDIQYAYNQIITCLAADVIIFNSNFNKDSFLNNIGKILKLLPDYRPKDLPSKITPKCKVLYFPIDFPSLSSQKGYSNILHIVWPHRWEFDKNPEAFFKVLHKLKKANKEFSVSILGETFTDVPGIFMEAKEILQSEIAHFGYVESKEEYFEVLNSSHIAVSTANHEFFGVSMLEAVYLGCLPVVPNRLVYPEIYPKQCLYNTEEELYARLSSYCDDPPLTLLHRKNLNLDFDLYSANKLLPKYLELFDVQIKSKKYLLFYYKINTCFVNFHKMALHLVYQGQLRLAIIRSSWPCCLLR